MRQPIPARAEGLEHADEQHAYARHAGSQEAEQAAALEAVAWLRAEGVLPNCDGDADGDGAASSAAGGAVVGSKRAKELEEDDSGAAPALGQLCRTRCRAPRRGRGLPAPRLDIGRHMLRRRLGAGRPGCGRSRPQQGERAPAALAASQVSPEM